MAGRLQSRKAQLGLAAAAAGLAGLAAASTALAGAGGGGGLGAALDANLWADEALRDGFVSAFLLIFFSEIGDKTFFIAVLLASRGQGTAQRAPVFAGTFGALAVMTLITVGCGRALHELDEVSVRAAAGPRSGRVG